MTQDERLFELDALVKSQGKVMLEYICQTYNISRDSARRDLVKLSLFPHILRIRGGVVLAEKQIEIAYVNRAHISPVKEKLAARAASFIRKKDILFIDAGTTSAALARFLPDDIDIITNSFEVIREIVDKQSIRKTILGGSFDDFSHTIIGNTTLEQIKMYHVDKTFIGVSALSENGISTTSEADALQKKAMAQYSNKVICISEAKKFNTQLMYQSCGWSEIDLIITDCPPPKNIMKKIDEFDIELIVMADD